MSRRYDVESVSILKLTVCPRLTLISVVKPWIEASPPPVTSHSDGGFPASRFSHMIALPFGGAHGSEAWAFGDDQLGATTVSATMVSRTTALSGLTCEGCSADFRFGCPAMSSPSTRSTDSRCYGLSIEARRRCEGLPSTG